MAQDRDSIAVLVDFILADVVDESGGANWVVAADEDALEIADMREQLQVSAREASGAEDGEGGGVGAGEMFGCDGGGGGGAEVGQIVGCFFPSWGLSMARWPL